MRSLWRALARKTPAPKRSRSYFVAAVAIISMAQQASPNAIGQSALRRPQSFTHSTLVRMTDCCSSGSRTASSAAGGIGTSGQGLGGPGEGGLAARARRERLGGDLGVGDARGRGPVEGAVRPHVDEARHQDDREGPDLEEGEPALALADHVAEDGGPGEEEGDLDVEHDEGQGHHVEADVESDPGLPDRRLAALVDRALARALRALRPQEPREDEVHDDEPEPYDEEDQDVGEVEVQGARLRRPRRAEDSKRPFRFSGDSRGSPRARKRCANGAGRAASERGAREIPLRALHSARPGQAPDTEGAMTRSSLAKGTVATGVLAALALIQALGPSPEVVRPASAAGTTIQDAFPGVTFDSPACVAAPSDGTDRLFVVERRGTIQVLKKWRGAGPAPAKKVFLDISSLQDPEFEKGHGGLVTMAFHPQFKTNGRFFVFYGSGKPYKAVIASYKVSPSNPDAADPQSGQIVFSLPKETKAHFGGGMVFGPDGKLYFGLGAPESAVDPAAPKDKDYWAQDTKRLDGKVCRIDVDGPAPYGIPPDNPWASGANGVRP